MKTYLNLSFFVLQAFICTITVGLQNPSTAKAQIFAPLQPNSNENSTSESRFKYSSKLQIEQATIESFFSVFSFDEVQDKSQLVQLAIMPTVKINLLKNLKFTAQGIIGLTTGRVQTRFDNPNFNALNLNELTLSYFPIEELSLEAGALNQNHLETPMLILDRAFPGVQAKSKFNVTDNFTLGLRAQYSIPNSVSFETDRTDNEAMPSFLTQGFDFNWKALEWLKIKGQVHHFTYNDLPSVVAFQSGRLGNEVEGIQSSQSKFLYEFDGFSQSYHFDFLISEKIVPKLNLQMIDNSEAPSDRSRSQWIGVGADIFFKNISITPSVAYFYAESDSVPALYSDVRLGRNNREGMNFKLKVNFIKSGFSLSANYTQANLIEPDPVQNDLRTLEFMLELPSVQF